MSNNIHTEYMFHILHVVNIDRLVLYYVGCMVEGNFTAVVGENLTDAILYLMVSLGFLKWRPLVKSRTITFHFRRDTGSCTWHSLCNLCSWWTRHDDGIPWEGYTWYTVCNLWWPYDMQTLPALLVIFEDNTPVWISTTTCQWYRVLMISLLLAWTRCWTKSLVVVIWYTNGPFY